jgi:hypothetical protein
MAGPGGTPAVRLSLVRADDMLDVAITAVNLRVTHGTDGPVLTRITAGAEARIVVTFPPQAVAEEAFAGEIRRPPYRAVLAGPSRLAFVVPSSVAAVPLTVDGLLGWSGLIPALAPNALPTGASGPAIAPAEPAADVTAVEVPFRVVLSPLRGGRWEHATAPVTRSGRTELWHTRLVAGPGGDGPAVRAIWTPDSAGAQEPRALTSLTPANRRDIVRFSSDFTMTNRSPTPFTAGLLMLSARGAWYDFTGAWVLPPPPLPPFDEMEMGQVAEQLIDESPLADDPVQFVRDNFLKSFPAAAADTAVLRAFLEILAGLFADRVGQFAEDWLAVLPVRRFEWRHTGTEGRDVYARVSTPGYLLPFGHRVTLVTVTERRLLPPPDVGLAAALVQQNYLVVNEPLKDFRPMLGLYRNAGRDNPFRTARIVTTSTTAIDPVPAGATTVWPQSGGQDMRWNVVCTDVEDRTVELSMPMLFMPELGPDGLRFNVREAGLTYRHSNRRHVAPGGQKIAFAEGRASQPGEAALATHAVEMDTRFDSSHVNLDAFPGGLPQFLPAINAATVRIPSVDALLGSAAAAAGTAIGFDPKYLASGFDAVANKAQVFARFTKIPSVPAFPGGQELAALALRFDPRQAGGLARPDMIVDCLSRLTGPLPDPAKLVGDIGALLPDAKILGGLSLKQLLLPLVQGLVVQQLPDLAGLDPDAMWAKLTAKAAAGVQALEVAVPMFVTRTLRNATNVPTAVETQYVWKPKLLSGAIPGMKVLTLGSTAQLVLATTIRAPLDGSPPAMQSRGELTGFSFEFAKVVRVSLGRLAFTMRDARKPDFTAEGVTLRFVGDLEFVNEIQKYIPAEGFSDPPAIAVTPAGIEAGYSLTLPSVGVGVFSLENLGLSARLTLPFVGDPVRMRFALSERHDPFLVTVSLFGGGGFFALDVDAAGHVGVEASIEFGGNFSLDLVVASGGVHVMAGFYFKMAGPDEVTLSGFLRAGGAVTVLGLITVSVEFYLALTYSTAPSGGKKLWGEASLTVGVDVLFFSASVTLPFRREFAGAAGDPSFEDLVDQPDWATYCAAFAP